MLPAATVRVVRSWRQPGARAATRPRTDTFQSLDLSNPNAMHQTTFDPFVMSSSAVSPRRLRLPAGRVWQALAAVAAALVVAGCSVQRVAPPAPVEDRTVQRSAHTEPGSGSPTDTATEPAKVLPPGAENAGKPGYFTVRPGDSLIRIGLEVGQNWRDLVRWNNLENPNRIEVDQVLRIVPPVAAPVPAPAATVAGSKPAPAGAAAGVTTTAISEPTLTAKPLSASPSAPAAQAGRTGADDVAFIWPASGAVVATFDEQKNKGLGIAGKAGDPVLAAADGRVVYAGSGLRGYGNLIILKHNNTFLTAYAHNQALLVKEDQDVKQGQKIADMGSSDADRVKLHFEVRRQGKPVDPARYLPAR